MQQLLDRLKEKSTWVGIVGIVASMLSAFNVVDLTDPQKGAIATAGLAITGVILVFIKPEKD